MNKERDFTDRRAHSPALETLLAKYRHILHKEENVRRQALKNAVV